MAIDLRKIRQQSIMGGFDNLTPDMGGVNPMGPSSPYEEDPFGGASPVSEPMREMNAGGMYDEAGPPPVKMGVGQYGSDMKAMIDQFYTPETTSRDRLNRLLDAAPERQEPDWKRKLVASGMGWGAKDPLATMEHVMYAPHQRAMADWKERTGPFQQAAQQENTANINERTLAGNVVVAKTQADKIGEQSRIADEKNRIAKIRADAYKLKAGGWTFKVTGDRVTGYSPSGETKDFGPSGAMDQADKIDLEGKWDVAAARERGAGAYAGTNLRETTQLRDSAGNFYLLDPSTQNLIPVGGAPATPVGKVERIDRNPSSAAGPNTLELMRQRSEQLGELYKLDPTLRKYIKRESISGVERFTLGNRPVATEASGIWPFNTEAVPQEEVDRWDAIKKHIDPTYIPPGGAPPKAISDAGRDFSTTTTTSVPPPPAGAVNQGIGPTRTPPADARGTRGSGPGTGLGPGVPAGGGRGGPQVPSGRGVPPADRSNIPEPPPSRKQQDFDVSQGLSLYLIKDGRIQGIIPNDPRSIAAAKKEGYEVRGKQ